MTYDPEAFSSAFDPLLKLWDPSKHYLPDAAPDTPAEPVTYVTTPPDTYVTWTAADYKSFYVNTPVVVQSSSFVPCPEGTCELCSSAGWSPDPATPTQSPSQSLVAAIPALSEMVACPCQNCKQNDEAGPANIWSIVIHLNDTNRWTREQIADWLETLDQDLQFTLPESPEITEGESR